MRHRKHAALPESMHAAYDWTASACELNVLATLRGDALEAYAAESESNAIEHGAKDVTASDLVELASWLKAKAANATDETRRWDSARTQGGGDHE